MPTIDSHAQLIDHESFGARMRLLRVRAGLTQEVLAERAGVAVATIAALEQGQRRRPYPHTVAALSHALGLGDAERMSLAMRERRVAGSFKSVHPAVPVIEVPALPPS